MPEHTHEWVAHYDQVVYGESFQCKCGDLMGTDEIVRRLNATEKLSAEDATELRDVSFGVALLDGEASEKSLRAIKAAEAYASALEGKDE